MWTTIEADCGAPPSNDPNAMISLGTASDTGVMALVDWISVKE